MQVSQLHAGVSGRPLAIRARPAVASRRSALLVQAKVIPLGKESRIGKLPIKIPAGVTFDVNGQHIAVKGKTGLAMEHTLPDILEIAKLDDGSWKISKRVESIKANQMHGLYRALTHNLVVGVSEGFSKELQLVGVGYRASVEGSDLTMNLGYSHPVVIPIPEGVKVQVQKNTTVLISGHDKAVVGDFAAKCRAKRKPEPYKQKGVRYANEIIRKKEGKRGK